MNIIEILTDLGIEEDAAKKAERAINKEIPQEFVKKDQYNKKVLELDNTKKDLSTAQSALADAEAFKTKVEDKEKALSDLQEQFDQYKTEQENTFNEFKQGVEAEKQTVQIQAALSDRLIKDGANPKLVKLLLKEIDTGKAELKDGDIANYDDLTKTVKEGYSEVFGTQKTEGAAVANPPAGGGNKNYTIEQIKAMSPKEINANWADVQKALKNNT